jgi:hypothetical protein
MNLPEIMWFIQKMNFSDSLYIQKQLWILSIGDIITS